MKVSELIEELKECNPNDIVVLSIDPEGNGYQTLSFMDGDYRYSQQDQQIGLRKLTSADKKQGYTESDVMHKDNGENCVVLWP